MRPLHNRSLFIAAAVSLALAPGCGGPESSEGAAQSRCLKLRPQGDVAVSRPARISLLFTVDTCAGEPVPGLTVGDFELSENGSAISPYESRMALVPRAQQHRTYTALLLDMSGSILHSGAWPSLRTAVEQFVDEVLVDAGDGHQVALLTFDGRAQPTEWVGYTSDRLELLAALDALEVRECTTSAQCAALPDRATCAAWRCVDDSTNLYGATAAGAQHVAQAVAAEGPAFRQGALVIFTDGTDQAARATRDDAESALRAADLHAFTVGLGGEVDEAALRALGRSGHFAAGQPDQLGAAFAQVAHRLTALAGRFYALDYCSPKRRGRHALELRARWTPPDGEPLQGTLEARFDADGFGPGCDI
jgi:hypothetical protein